MGREINSRGNKSAQIMIVSDGPSAEDVKWGKLWCNGIVTSTLADLLNECEINPKDCFYSMACSERPENSEKEGMRTFLKHVATKKVEVTPDHELVDGLWVNSTLRRGRDRLRCEIEEVRPHVVVAMGPMALWALTGRVGLEDWRGSLEQCCLVEWPMKVIPTYHPSSLWIRPELKQLVKLDLRRVKRESDKRDFPELIERFTIEPDFETCCSILSNLLNNLQHGIVKIAYDIETRAGCVACISLAWSDKDAICVPFMDVENLYGYWSESEEVEIMCLLYRIMINKNFGGIAQNGAYDNNFMYEKWLWSPRMIRDTMITQHAMFPTGAMTSGEDGEEAKKTADKGSFKKNLGYLSSIYRKQHFYWKNTLDEWDQE